MTKQSSRMTAIQKRLLYNAILSRWGLTPYAAAPKLELSVRQAHRYASGDSEIPDHYAKFLRDIAKRELTAKTVAAI